MRRWILISAIVIISLATWTTVSGRTFRHLEIARSFLNSRQSRTNRVEVARKEKDGYLREVFLSENLPYPPQKIAILIFKREKKLEVWAFSPKSRQYKLAKTYDICATSGLLGPKRREGDLQIPEGVYYIDRFNPWSHFYLSLGINYPNASDRIRGNRNSPGGDIFIHGSCVTIAAYP